jgi:acyl-CoA synthetase (AMP-forming)/AMP-acid ligase II
MGDAKMVCFTQTNLLGNASRCIQRFGLEHHSRITIAVPIFHMYGLGAALIPAILVGASIDIQANTNILRFLQHERNFNPDTIYLNPTICTMLLKGRRQDKYFKQTISAGAVLPPALALEYQRRFGTITNLYGSSEMGVIATISSKDLSLEHPAIFTPLIGVAMQIDTVENALYCLHPNGFNGYFNSQGKALDTEPYPYNTGDRAEADNTIATNFKLIGRQGNSSNRSGFLVQFDEIENALRDMAEIEQVIVLSSEEETIRGQKLYAFCIMEKQAMTVNKDALRKACFERLPKYAVPDEIILQKTFPLAASGKIDRQALKQKIASKLIKNS